jgi:signal transduction histidine kinase
VIVRARPCLTPIARRLLGAILFWMVALSSGYGLAEKRVLVLHDGAPDLPYRIITERELARGLSSDRNQQIQVFDEYLDNWRLGVDPFLIQNSLQLKYAKSKPDLVLADGESAFRLMTQLGSQMFPGVPVVYLTLPNRFVQGKIIPPNFTGVFTYVDYAATVRLAKQLQPDLKQVFYVKGASPEETASMDAVRHELSFLPAGVDLVYLVGLPMKDLLARVGNLPAHSAILYDSVYQDGDKKIYIPAEACALVASRTNVPVYSLYETMLGRGTVGGVMVNFEEIAKQASEMALTILRGIDVSEVGSRQSKNDVMLDLQQVRRFRLREAGIPKNAILVNQPRSVWIKYRFYILAASGIVLLQCFWINRLLCEARERRTLAGRLIYAQEDERKRIARELHDDVSQRMAFLSIKLDSLRSCPPPSAEVLDEALTALYDQIDTVSGDIHQLSHDLHSTVLEHLGLVPGLRRHCEEFSQYQQVQVEFEVRGDQVSIQSELGLSILRVAQESLSNVAKHSRALSAKVTLTYKTNLVKLEVEDSGIGFSPDKSPGKAGLGMISMQERLRLVGGTLRIQSSPGGGTRVTAIAPLPSSSIHMPNPQPESFPSVLDRSA